MISIDAIPTGDEGACSGVLGRNLGIGEGEGSEAEDGVVVSDHASWDFRGGILILGFRGVVSVCGNLSEEIMRITMLLRVDIQRYMRYFRRDMMLLYGFLECWCFVGGSIGLSCMHLYGL